MNQNTNIKLQLQIKDVTFTQSHRPEEAIPDSCEKCEPGFRATIRSKKGGRLNNRKVGG